jgi:WhiB family redox-sensing transcriptional regulator
VITTIDIPRGEDLAWREQGACNNPYVDYTVFFPPYDSPSGNAAAKKICDRCPVKAQCLAWALKYDEMGIWGGTGEADRRAIKRRRVRKTCLSCDSNAIVEENHAEVCLACGMSWLT